VEGATELQGNSVSAAGGDGFVDDGDDEECAGDGHEGGFVSPSEGGSEDAGGDAGEVGPVAWFHALESKGGCGPGGLGPARVAQPPCHRCRHGGSPCRHG
jgi:hypothetical protein